MSKDDKNFNNFFNKQNRSIFITRMCHKDPEDDKMLICKIKERKIDDGNEINEEREERVPINMN